MAKEPKRKKAAPTKKHLARIERERLQTRYILIGTTIIVILVIGIIAYGVLEQNVLRGLRAIAVVNGEKISANEFREFTKFYRYQMIQEAQQVFQIISLFGNDPDTSASFISQLQSIADGLDAFRAGQVALDQIIDDRLIRQEAAKRGITVSPEEIEKGLQAALRYYSDGTPTPTTSIEILPTSTLSPLQLTLMPTTPTIAPTSTPTITVETSPTVTPTIILTPTATEVLTPTATATTAPTPTPYTLEAYQEIYATMVADYEENVGIPEERVRYVMEAQLYQEKLLDEVIGEIPCVEEQIWAFHILADNEELAKDIYKRLSEGEDWYSLASTYSLDNSNKDNGGDLGWFGKGDMVPEFEEAAFALEVGETSQPVQSQFGWHIIRVLGHEDRPLEGVGCLQLADKKFQEWLNQLRENSDVEIDNFWQTVVPLLPTLPPEIQGVLQQAPGGSPGEFPPQP